MLENVSTAEFSKLDTVLLLRIFCQCFYATLKGDNIWEVSVSG